MIRAANRRDRSANIYFRVADAESLPFGDGEFDAVVSTFGVIFCNHPEQAAAELARVCKSGGRLVLTSWEERGSVYEMFQLIEKHNPQRGERLACVFDWAAPERLRTLLGDGFELGFEQAISFYRENNTARAWENFSTGFGPVKSLLAKLHDDAAAEFRRDFDAMHERHRTDAGILVPRPYVLTAGTRRK